MRLPLSLVVAALGVAAGSGGSWAIANARQTETADRVEVHEKQISDLRDRQLRIEILSEQTNKTVERIERKLDRRERTP